MSCRNLLLAPWQEARQNEARHLRRELSTWIDDDGMVMIRGRLTPDVGVVVQRALEAAADRLYRELALIRFSGRFRYADRVSSCCLCVCEPDDGCGRGGKRRCGPFSTASTPSSLARRSKAAGLIWPSVECRRRWL